MNEGTEVSETKFLRLVVKLIVFLNQTTLVSPLYIPITTHVIENRRARRERRRKKKKKKSLARYNLQNSCLTFHPGHTYTHKHKPFENFGTIFRHFTALCFVCTSQVRNDGPKEIEKVHQMRIIKTFQSEK